jgi:ribosomal protein S18 acetylase RimI-like enzyme
MKLQLEKASKEIAAGICDLVNIAYRGETGWTKETALVSGQRSSVEEIEKTISDPAAHLLVAIENEQVLACICIEEKAGSAYIGLFAVHPQYQGSGLGNEVLAQAEKYASTKLVADKYIMLVLSQRVELIQYYERRGYRRTGDRQQYPRHLKVGTPMRDDLTVEYLEKNIASKAR